MKRELALSAEELVAYLRHSSLTTILVEGSSDAFVYRCVQGKLIGGDILICRGRDTLLEVFSRRSEFNNIKTVFVADKDMWFFTGVPNRYASEVVFTAGYSIENDIYIASVFEGLLDQDERLGFDKLLNQLAIWFGAEVEKFIATGRCDCSSHVNKVCPGDTLCERYKAAVGFKEPAAKLVATIRQDYQAALRGRTLFEALVRFLSHSKRASKFSKYNLLEMGSKFANPKLDALVAAINSRCVA